METLGDILVFAARLEARWPANSEVMKVILFDNIIKTLVQKVVVGTDDELKLEKALLRHVFCSMDKSVDTLKTSITTACRAKEVSDMFNSDDSQVHFDSSASSVSLGSTRSVSSCTLPTPRHLISYTGFQR